MNAVIRAVGKVLRLVGISSPEDNAPRVKTAGDPPSWRDAEEEDRDEGGGRS